MNNPKLGRPAEIVPQDQAEAIVTWITEGRTLRDYCRQSGAPNWNTVYAWVQKDADFAERIAKARDAGADAIAEDILQMIDSQPTILEGGKIDPAHVQWMRVRADMRLRLLSKWRPSKYGDKVQIGGDSASGPIQISDTERASKIAAILAAANARGAAAEAQADTQTEQ